MSKNLVLSEEKIQNSILILRGKKVIIDSDLAQFYGATTKRLNEAVKRNSNRFPDDFMFQLTEKEKEYVVTNCDHLAGIRFSPHLPYAFTEYGAVMAANVLNSVIAVQASILVVRVFVKTSELIATHKELLEKVGKLEKKLGSGLKKHDKEIRILFEAIHGLMNPPNPPRKKIGFKIGKEK